MYTGIYSDGEGWNQFITKNTRDEVISWFMDEGIDVTDPTECNENWWNPSPTIIGPDHKRETFDGFKY